MAKLKVGDILIDGDKIVIGGQQMVAGQTHQSVSYSSHSSSATSPRASTSDPVESLAKALRAIPVPGSVLSGVGVLAIAAGAVAWLIMAPVTSVLGLSLRMAPFLLGAPAVLVGILKWWSNRNGLLSQSEGMDDLLRRRLALLRPALSSGSEDNTIEALGERTSMTERALIEALTDLKERGLVEEDLDIETGHWFYRLSEKALSPGEEAMHLPLEERARKIGTRG